MFFFIYCPTQLTTFRDYSFLDVHIRNFPLQRNSPLKKYRKSHNLCKVYESMVELYLILRKNKSQNDGFSYYGRALLMFSRALLSCRRTCYNNNDSAPRSSKDYV